MSNQVISITIEQPDETASQAFADAALAESGRVFSKGRKHGRKSSSVDNTVDSYFNETAQVENKRVLAKAIEKGLLPSTNDKGEPTTTSALKWNHNYEGCGMRADAYDAIVGMANGDEKFRPSIDSTTKLGSRIKNLIGFGAEVRIPDIKLFVEKYLTEVYLKSEGVSEYLTIEDLNPTTVEEQAALMDAEALAATE